MTSRYRAAAWSAVAICLALLAVALVFAALNEASPVEGSDQGGIGPAGWLVLGALPAAAFSTIGGLIATRRANRVGWLCLAIGFLWAVVLAADAVGTWGRGEGRLGDAAGWILWLGWLWVPAVGLMGMHLPLRLPDGRLLSRRWRRYSWACSGAIALVSAFIATEPSPADATAANPAGTELLQPLAPAFALVPLGILGAVWSVALRYRRAHDPLARVQIRWIAFGAAISATAYLGVVAALAATGFPDDGPLVDTVAAIGLVGFTATPVAIGIAVLRHRLYDVDLVINRALVYGSLTALLAGTYLGSVLLLGLALSPLTEQSDLAIAVSTLAVAALFQPVRRRLQRLVDRRFYRHKYDAARTLEGFSSRLKAQTDLEALRADLAEVVRETMQPAHVSVWLRRPRAVTIAVTMSGHRPDTTEER